MLLKDVFTVSLSSVTIPGYVVLGIALLIVLPILTAILVQEWNPFWDFVITMAISVILGLLLIIIGKETRLNKSFVQWKHGFVVASLSWIILMFLCAIPYLLSGHVNSILDACFDVMSGFTTTGMVLTQDLDHISLSLNLWRHMLTFIGGQGMIVLALTFLLKDTGGAYIFYVGEAKDIDLVPNVKGTARIIWKISMVYLVIGTAAFWLDGMAIGLNPLSAFFNGLFIFASSWSTGVFNQACAQHGGDVDIHSNSITIMAAGYATTESVPAPKIIIGLLLVCLALVLGLIYLKVIKKSDG